MSTTACVAAALVEHSAVALRQMIGAREISPVELLEACIERIEALNSFVNAVTATCLDRARDESRAAERKVLKGEPLGLLHGLPLGRERPGTHRRPADHLWLARLPWPRGDVDPDIRATFADRIAAMQHLFASCDAVHFDLGEVHRCFDVLRAEAFVAGMREIYEKDAASLGENPRANYELGASMSLLDSAWAQVEQTRILQRFQAAFADYDLVLAPTTPVSPFPWTEPYARVVDGKPQSNYYRWLALTYVTTLTTHPALTLPCGTDGKGMPFGLQVVGPFRGDLQVLSAALALEQAFATDPALRRPRPDLAALRMPNPALNSIVTAPPPANWREPGFAGGSATSVV